MDPRPEGASLLYDSRIDLLCCSVSLHLKGTWETQNHQTFCMRLVLVSFTLLIYSCMSIIIETFHDQYFSLTSEDSLRYSKPRVPEDQGTVMTSRSVRKLCSCHSHYSAIHVHYCHFTLMFAQGTLCFVKL